METWSSYIDGLGREGCAADPAALLRPGLELELIRQPADMGRPFAVAVHRRGVLIGYLPKPDARPVAKLLDRGGRARAFVLALRQERSFTGSRLKSVTIEIEAANPDSAPWTDSDRAEILALGAEAPIAPRRTPGLATQGRIVGALCAAVVAVAAWANIPELADDLDGPDESALIVARDDGTDALVPVRADKARDKTQERPAGAPTELDNVQALPLLPQAALSLPSNFTPFAGEAGAPPVEVKVATVQKPVAGGSAAPEVTDATPTVPLPLPRPNVRQSRRR